MSVRLASGLQVDLRVVPSTSFGAALQYFTGSKEHNVVLRGIAKDRGLKINEWGVFRTSDGQDDEYLAGKSEVDVYQQLDLPCYPPELRENRGEFACTSEEDLPQLIELDAPAPTCTCILRLRMVRTRSSRWSRPHSSGDSTTLRSPTTQNE